MLRLSERTYLEMVGHAYDGLPDEACGLFAAAPGRPKVERFYPCRNAAQSSRVYTIDDHDYMRSERHADDNGLELIGVMHSHTHTDAYPSPTDVDQAIADWWHYVIVSLRDGAPVMRSFLIRDGKIDEEPVVVERR